jgi:hypothetical protein
MIYLQGTEYEICMGSEQDHQKHDPEQITVCLQIGEHEVETGKDYNYEERDPETERMF